MAKYEVRLRRSVGGRCVVALVDTSNERVVAKTTLQGSGTRSGMPWFDMGELPLDIELTTVEK